MAKARALINKLKRREKQIKNAADGFDTYNKMDRAEETMAKSPKAYQLTRKVQRRLDRNFGINTLGDEPKISKRKNINTVERFDFGSSDFGTRLTMAANLIADIGAQPGDLVLFLEGVLKGQYLKVVSVVDSTHLRLEDASSLNDPGKAEKTKVSCVADVAGSLDGTSFTLHSANDATAYYVWYDVDAGGNDPMGVGTGVPVSISSGASAATVAAATAAAIDALAPFLAASSQNEVYITNAAVGPSTDAADVDTGFTIAVLIQGSAANPTVSESNIIGRFQISDVKGSYR